MKCDTFQKHLKSVFHNTIPVSFVTFTDNTKPWITPLIKQLINERWSAYRQRNYQLYNHLKQKTRKEIEKSKIIWAKKVKSQNMWKMVNDLLCRKTRDPMKAMYSRFDSIETAANTINHKLTEVFSEKLFVPFTLSAFDPKEIVITEQQVYDLLRKLPNHKASPDIPLKLYKAAASILAPPLTEIFKQSVKEGVVPNVWKISAVTPLPKTNNPTSTDDIRPISLLPPPVKILERIILHFARPHFLQEYGNDQFGFRAGSSTTCALISLHDHITKSVDLHCVAGVQVISYDFSKAFDKLRHDVIINRLLDCNFPRPLICWLSNYLENRMQFVKIGTVCSQPLEVTSGVPQGSILGPFLFSVVMGSLEIQDESCCVVKYADDITVSVPIYKNSENEHVIKLHNTIKNGLRLSGFL